MARLRRRWRVAKWVGLIACLVLLLAWLGPRPWNGGVSFTMVDQTNSTTFNPNPNQNQPATAYCIPKLYVVLVDGSLQVAWGFQRPVSFQPGWRAFRLPDGSSTPWLPSLGMVGTTAPHMHVVLPLWLLFLSAAIPSSYLFWRDRRIPPHCCQSCGYDLTGNTSGTCPECGMEVP